LLPNTTLNVQSINCSTFLAGGKSASENGTEKTQEQIPGFDISTTVGGQRQISIGSCTQVSGEFCEPSNRPDTGRTPELPSAFHMLVFHVAQKRGKKEEEKMIPTNIFVFMTILFHFESQGSNFYR